MKTKIGRHERIPHVSCVHIICKLNSRIPHAEHQMLEQNGSLSHFIIWSKI